MDTSNVMTQAGYDELVQELEERKNETRTKIANDIELARQQGDLSENAAYKAAMEAKEFNETKINELENEIKTAIVKEGTDASKVELGDKFKLTSEEGREMEYSLVGSTEANPAEKKLSVESPIGAAVYGKSYGTSVDIELPSGEVTFKIEKV